jgi:mitochondrial chaperone BCS1
VILKKGLFESILSDVNNFLSREEWYCKRGIPFRRIFLFNKKGGYLLYGPSGTGIIKFKEGKSSTIFSLCGVLNFNICVLNLSCSELTDDKLQELFLNAPRNCAFLIEDIDSLIKSSNENITYSGLINGKLIIK